MRRKLWIFLGASLTAVIIVIFYQENLYINSIYRYGSRQILQAVHFRGAGAENVLNFDVSLPSEPSGDTGDVENVPPIYLEGNKMPKSFNKTCAPFPGLFDLKFTNDHWQTQETSNGTFQLLNAYLDDRELNKDGRTVRIVAMLNRIGPEMPTYCQLWFGEGKPPLVVRSDKYFYIWTKGWGGEKQGIYQPYLIPCNLPKDVKEVPISVSLVEKVCDKATNNLAVRYPRFEEKKNFVVCVKGLNFPDEDKTVRLAEWIELLNLLGAEKINFYEFSVHPNVKKLLNYYTERGKIEVTPLTLVGYSSNHPLLQSQFLHKKTVERRLQEVIPYNDCLYKHMYEYNYVVLLDIDEVIVPETDTWVELIQELEREHKGKTGAYVATNVYFLDSHQHQHEWFNDIPKYMHMLQHVYRARNYTKPGYYIKCFHDTEVVQALHNHFPKACLTGSCRTVTINTKIAHLQHYRSDCVKGVGNCAGLKADSVMDTRVWNFKNELIERVSRALMDLGFLVRKY